MSSVSWASLSLCPLQLGDPLGLAQWVHLEHCGQTQQGRRNLFLSLSPLGGENKGCQVLSGESNGTQLKYSTVIYF